MSLISRIFHSAVQLYQRKSHQDFLKSLNDLRAVQNEKLEETLKYLRQVFPHIPPIDSYAQFTELYPVTSYVDHAPFIKAQKQKSLGGTAWPEIVRFQPTSGSTDTMKWIPYTHQLLKDFDAALGPWLYDFYQSKPQVLSGSHYWSFSWLPEDLRKEGLKLDDTELFPFWKRLFLKKTMAFVEPVDRTATSEISMFATVVYLVHREDLAFVSVWSPTYWIHLVEFLAKHREAVMQSLQQGRWGLFEKELESMPCPRNKKQAMKLLKDVDLGSIWPRLKTLSAWNTSTSQAFAQQISERWPSLTVVGKGLWATEACVTIPFQGRYVLAVKSHFFEFEDLETGFVHPAWDLKQDQVVCPIVTTSGGLIRYKMQDALRVTGFLKAAPCFEFLGRSDGIDLVGEKTSNLRALEVLNEMTTKDREAFLFAVKGQKNYYCAVVDEANLGHGQQQLSEKLEALMSESFHYRLARELGQLEKAQVHLVREPVRPYTQLHLNRGMVLGNIKLEPLRLVTEKELQESFRCP